MVGVVYIINCFKGVQKMRTGKLIMYFLFYFFRLRIQTLLIAIFVIQIYQWKTERCKDILLRNSFLEFHEKLFAIMLRIFLQNENSIKSRSEHKTLFRKKQLYSFIQHFCQHLNKIIQKIWTISKLAGRSILLYKFHMASLSTSIPHLPPFSSYFD